MINSLKRLRWDWIFFGWFMAVAIASLLLLGLNTFGLMGTGSGDESLAVALSLVVGFLLMGFFVGTRVVAAPILHALAMALVSAVVWLAVNFFAGALAGSADWWPIEPGTILSLFGLQAVAAVLGTRIGVRRARAFRRN
ncbi:MAG: hypothetical protein LBG44_10615 [Gemmatimonadota bacterium]|jgi:hypothetical protein|nr:hypothetical protein [Gemmatimonadota bacterium]